MKALFLAMTALLSVSAMADQCMGISRAEAEKAVLLLQKGAVITEYCEPCSESAKDAKVLTVKKVEISNLASYSSVKVNGNTIDLAYTFLKVAPNRSVNLAKAVSCESLDDSTVSSVIDADLNTIQR